MKDFCYYKALTIHQLIQFRTPALPCYAARHSLTVLSHGITPAIKPYNTEQDYTLCNSVVAKCPTELLLHYHLFMQLNYGPLNLNFRLAETAAGPDTMTAR